MILDEIPSLANVIADQIRKRTPPVPRVESTADLDIALLYEMVAVIAAAVEDLVEQHDLRQ